MAWYVPLTFVFFVIAVASAGVSSEPIPPFNEIFKTYAQRVWRTLKRLRVRDEDVDDVAQEVFLVVSKQLATFEGRSKLSTWIYSICVRVASEYRRRPYVRRETLVDEMPEHHDGGAFEESFAREEAKKKLDSILDSLDDDKRTTFVLFEIERLQMPEIAEIMGCPQQTAYYRLHAARKIVEERIAEMRAGEEARI